MERLRAKHSALNIELSTPFSENFADRLEKVLKNNTVRGLSRETGLSETVIRAYRKGSDPSRRALVAISSATGASIEWLATGVGPMRPSGQESSVPHKHLLKSAIRICEQGLKEADLELEADKKAEVIWLIYELHCEDAPAEVSPNFVQKLLRVAV